MRGAKKKIAPNAALLKLRYEELGSIKAVAEFYAVSHGTASIWLKDAGVAVRSHGVKKPGHMAAGSNSWVGSLPKASNRPHV